MDVPLTVSAAMERATVAARILGIAVNQFTVLADRLYVSG